MDNWKAKVISTQKERDAYALELAKSGKTVTRIMKEIKAKFGVGAGFYHTRKLVGQVPSRTSSRGCYNKTKLASEERSVFMTELVKQKPGIRLSEVRSKVYAKFKCRIKAKTFSMLKASLNLPDSKELTVASAKKDLNDALRSGTKTVLEQRVEQYIIPVMQAFDVKSISVSMESINGEFRPILTTETVKKTVL
jgi:hypothetical protein